MDRTLSARPLSYGKQYLRILPNSLQGTMRAEYLQGPYDGYTDSIDESGEVVGLLPDKLESDW
jgi:hypothetical protein